jgi:hypothetical protein
MVESDKLARGRSLAEGRPGQRQQQATRMQTRTRPRPVCRVDHCVGDPATAIPYNLTALSIRADIGSPDGRIDLHWLARQQRDIGADAFRQILDTHLDPDTVTVVLDRIARVALDDE